MAETFRGGTFLFLITMRWGRFLFWRMKGEGGKRGTNDRFIHSERDFLRMAGLIVIDRLIYLWD